MNQYSDVLSVTIDNKHYEVAKGLTILQAAEQNDIYIPTLCAHKDLTPYGGCRLCLVEVEGARGFLTACTTPVEDRMIVRTHTDQIQKERREILELILSEHTSSCLICDEEEECKKFMSTIRKVGVTTGCRYCPNDDQCELEKVVKWLGIKEINHPVYYRSLPVEKEDPFYDRDYNLCIYCGRCVRVCQEVRNANVLAFNQRGHLTVIGPAFGRNHIEAGCEFCGACVSICPTGALAEKFNKWDGLPDREIMTTCAFCGVGCQMRVLIKNNKVIGTQPAEDELVNHGQLCVKGRFCVNEFVNDYRRLKKPLKALNDTNLAITWDEAIDIAAQRLLNCAPEEFAMLISPNCTNEDLYIAQKFTRVVMGSHDIDTSARLFYGPAFNNYINLMKKSVPLSQVEQSSVILAVGLDMRYGRSVVGVRLRKAIARGAKIITIHPKDHSLALSAGVWIQPSPGEEVDVLESLVRLTGDEKAKHENGELLKIAELLKNGSNPVILVGADFIQYNHSPQILQAIEKLASNINAGILPLPAQNNLYGSLMMGTYPELLPGAFPASDQKQFDRLKNLWSQTIPPYNPDWNARSFIANKKLKVVYLIGEAPPFSEPMADFVIYQNIYPLESSFQAGLSLPATAFTEIDGTFINGEGRIQRINKATDPPGEALPDWQILCKVAQQMGAQGFDYLEVAEIHDEIATIVPVFGDFNNLERKANPLPDNVKLNFQTPKQTERGFKNTEFPFMLTASPAENFYRGIPITEKVEGLRKLIGEEVLYISREDAVRMSVSNGDEVIVMSDQFERSLPVWISNQQKSGTLHIIQRQGIPINPNPHYVKLRG